MSLRNKVIFALLALVITFSVGRYSAKIGSAPTTKTIVDTKTYIKTNTDKDEHKIETITKKPNGEVVTVIKDDTATVVSQADNTVSHQDTTVIPPKLSTLNVSALVGTDPMNSFKPLYGFSVSKQFIGPVTIGLWGLTNSTVGISLGLNF